MTTGEIENWKDWLAGSLVDAEPEAVARLLKICVSAEGLFHGDRQAARRWLQNPAYVFKEESPLERAMTEEGSRDVETLIGQLRHGIPT